MKPVTDQLEADILKALPPFTQGWCTPEKALLEASIIIEHQLKTVVEIGVFGGSSLVPKAIALRTTGGRVYGIDPWRKEACFDDDNGEKNNDWWASVDHDAIHNQCVARIWELRLNEQVVLIRAKAEQCTDLFQAESIDWLEIDGNHSAEASCRDVTLWLPKVRKGGYVMFDDYDWASTQQAAEMIERECDTVIPGGGKFMIYRKR